MTIDSFMVNFWLYSPSGQPFISLVCRTWLDFAFSMTPQRFDVVLQTRASQRFRLTPLYSRSNSTNKMLISLLKGWGEEAALFRDYRNWI